MSEARFIKILNFLFAGYPSSISYGMLPTGILETGYKGISVSESSTCVVTVNSYKGTIANQSSLQVKERILSTVLEITSDIDLRKDNVISRMVKRIDFHISILKQRVANTVKKGSHNMHHFSRVYHMGKLLFLSKKAYLSSGTNYFGNNNITPYEKLSVL